MFAVGQVQGSDGKPFNPNFQPSFTSRVVSPEWQNHDLGIDDKFTVTPDQVFHTVIGFGPKMADIAIVVEYRPAYLPWKLEKMFRFKTYRQTNGNLYWYSAPLR